MIIERLFKLLKLNIILLLIITGNSFAAEARKISLDSALSIAVKNNHDINASKLNINKSRAMVNEAIGYALPNVSINANFTRNIKIPVMYLPGVFINQPNVDFIGVQFGAKNNYQAMLTVNQVLFNSGVFTGIGTSRIYENASYEMYKASVSKIILSTKKAFYWVLLAKEFWNTMKVSLEKSQDNLKTVSAVFNEGLIPEYDYIRARVGVENLKPLVLQAESGYINSLNSLKMLMAINISDSIEIEGDLKSFIDDLNYSEDELLNKSIQNNYDLKALDIQKNVTEDIITIRKSEYFPTISAFYNYMFNGVSNSFEFQNSQSSSIGINLSLSLFQGLQSSARVEQAKIDYLTLEDRYSQLKDVLRLQIKAAFLQITTSRERMKAQDENVIQAERGYEISRIRYKEGVGSQVEINDADVALTQAKNNRSQSFFDYLSARADLDNLIGNVDNRFFKIIKE
ncbi:MAG: TolC family protein [Bacteroidetes bacterium]|nr:MAG: TolC family protein [Bacteroidota bacterium]